MRPAELADDHTGVTEVVAHSTQYLLDQGAELLRSAASTRPRPSCAPKTSRRA